jgi:sarcosine oxidase, subunit delta
MLQIVCPHCGEARDEQEFHYRGQAHVQRPADPDTVDDLAWGDYLFFRENPCGPHHELWYHVSCRKLFNATRDTRSYRVLETYRIGAQPAHGPCAEGTPSLRPAARGDQP